MRRRGAIAAALVAVGVGTLGVPGGAAAASAGGVVAARPTTQVAEHVVGHRPATRNPAAFTAAAKPKKKTVALTFDDGPSDYTYQVLDILKKHKVKATFCMIGNNMESYPKTSLRIPKEGHLVCNHTRSHPDLTTLSTAAVRRELTGAQAQIKAATKVTPTTVRFPYGASNTAVRRVAKELELRALGWSIDTLDWQNPPAKTITARIVGKAKSGDVVLMHDGGGDRTRTVASLEQTIKQLKKKGFTFVVA